MNRSFPGNPLGPLTEKIADYFHRTLLPLADYVVDFHSGGKTMEFLPFCCAHVLADKDRQVGCITAMQAFNAPYSVMLLETLRKSPMAEVQRPLSSKSPRKVSVNGPQAPPPGLRRR